MLLPLSKITPGRMAQPGRTAAGNSCCLLFPTFHLQLRSVLCVSDPVGVGRRLLGAATLKQDNASAHGPAWEDCSWEQAGLLKREIYSVLFCVFRPGGRGAEVTRRRYPEAG